MANHIIHIELTIEILRGGSHPTTKVPFVPQDWISMMCCFFQTNSKWGFPPNYQSSFWGSPHQTPQTGSQWCVFFKPMWWCLPWPEIWSDVVWSQWRGLVVNVILNDVVCCANMVWMTWFVVPTWFEWCGLLRYHVLNDVVFFAHPVGITRFELQNVLEWCDIPPMEG